MRSEAAKVTWPSRRETMITTAMVFVMVAITSVFFLVADQLVRFLVTLILGIGQKYAADGWIGAMSKRWYIVQAYSNFEQKVAESIREQAKQRHLDHLFDEVIVPKEKVVEVRRGRKVDAERKFFPGYVLVKMDLTDEAYHLIKNTPKVTGFLGSDNKPMPISDAEAARILHQVQGGHRAAEAFGHVRGRRAGAGLRRPLRIVQRHGRGGRRRPLAAQGRGLDFRPGDPGGTRVRTGREAC